MDSATTRRRWDVFRWSASATFAPMWARWWPSCWARTLHSSPRRRFTSTA